MFYCEFLAPFTFEKIFSLLSSFQHGFFKKLNVIYICFETAFSIHYLAVCCFPFSSLHAAKHDIFMPILLYKCQVDRIGKRSPEWWQLKDKEGKPRQHIKKPRHQTLPTKAHLVKAMVLPVVIYGCESWTIKKAECQRIDAFELWYWRKLL